MEMASEKRGEISTRLLDEKYTHQEEDIDQLLDDIMKLSNLLTPKLYRFVKRTRTHVFATKYIQAVGRLDELVGGSWWQPYEDGKLNEVVRAQMDEIEVLLAEVADELEE